MNSKIMTPQVGKSELTDSVKIKLPEKLAFFCANLGNIPIMTILSSFLLIFYTDIAKLNPASVGVLFIVARIVDAICDPFIGYIIDHLPPMKWGRFRPWLALGSVICSLNFVLLWLGPSMASSGKLTIAYISYLLLGPTFAIMDISLNSLLPVMTDSVKERNTLSSIKGFAYVLGIGVCSIIVVPFVASFSTPKQGWYTLIIVIAAFVLILSLIGALGTRERVEPVKKENYTASIMLKIVFRTYPLIILYISILLCQVGYQIRAGASIYYLTYNLKNADLMVLFSMVMLIGMIAGVLSVPRFANKFEKKNVTAISFFIMAISMLILIFIPNNSIVLFMISNFFTSFGYGGILSMNFGLQADVIDYAEFKHGYRAEGMVSSMNSFISKFAMAIGGAIPAFILSITGYIPNAETQNSSVLQGVMLSMSLIPFALILIAGLVFLLYPLNHELFNKVTKELKKMRSV